jgi:hypothetical protein
MYHLFSVNHSGQQSVAETVLASNRQHLSLEMRVLALKEPLLWTYYFTVVNDLVVQVDYFVLGGYDSHA